MSWVSIVGHTNTHKGEITEIFSAYLQEKKIPSTKTSDPKGTETSYKINGFVEHLCGKNLTGLNQSPLASDAETLLSMAGSVQVMREVIDQALIEQQIVISRGSPFDSLVYQLGDRRDMWGTVLKTWQTFRQLLPDLIVISLARTYQDSVAIRAKEHPDTFESFDEETFNVYQERFKAMGKFLEEQGVKVIQLETSHNDDIGSIVREKIFHEVCRLSICGALLQANRNPFFAEKLITLKPLNECQETIPQLAQWMYDQWKSYDTSLTLEKMSKSFEDRLNNDRIPFVVIALKNNQPIGMIALKEKGAEELTDICPSNAAWIGSLFVVPDERRKGIAGNLLKLIISIGKKLGHQEVFVYTSDRSNIKWYTDREAVIVREGHPFRDHQITIMKFN